MNKIEYFTLHNNKGISILAKDLLKWVDPYDKKNDVFAPIISYSWMVNGTEFKVIKHGTALDLAGRGQASTGSLCEAIKLAEQLARGG